MWLQVKNSQSGSSSPGRKRSGAGMSRVLLCKFTTCWRRRGKVFPESFWGRPWQVSQVVHKTQESGEAVGGVLETIMVPGGTCANAFLVDRAAIRAPVFLSPSGRDPLLCACCCMGFFPGPPRTSGLSPTGSKGITPCGESSKTRLAARAPTPATSPTVLPSHRTPPCPPGLAPKDPLDGPTLCQLTEPFAALETGPRSPNRLDRLVY